MVGVSAGADVVATGQVSSTGKTFGKFQSDLS